MAIESRIKSLFLIIGICFLLVPGADAGLPSVFYDSVGIRKEGNRRFIIHQVEEKETVYGLSRRYQVDIATIEAHNDLTEGLKVGQEIKILFEQVPETVSSQPTQTNKVAARGSTHTVAAGETLYRIATNYGVSVSDLRVWNNLTGNEISVGQELWITKPDKGSDNPVVKDPEVAVPKTNPANSQQTHIVLKGETLYGISKLYDVPMTDLQAWNDLPDINISVGRELIIKDPGEKKVVTTTASNQNENKSAAEKNTAATTAKSNETVSEKSRLPDASGFSNRVMENGFAERIDGSSDYRKYLALHRTAPLGTILTVRNEMNDITIFVRVVGKLPDTPGNAKTMIKLSKTACDKLGAINDRFPVEVTYYP